MDQIKKILAALKKHHFWVLSALVLCLVLFGWYSAVSALSQQFAQQKTKIKAEFDGLRKITSTTNHPNDKFTAEMARVTDIRKTDVERAWQSVFDRQRGKVLKWPSVSDNFIDYMESLGAKDEIGRDYRMDYMSYIKQEFPKLVELVDARPYWVADEGGNPGLQPGRFQPAGRGGRGARGPARELETVNANRDYRLVWNPKNQREIDDSLNFGEEPSSELMRYTQENLWVTRALLEAIAKVNEKATGHYNAKIKELIQLSVAQEAAALFKDAIAAGRVVKPTATLTAAEDPLAAGGPGGPPPPGAEMGPGGPGDAAGGPKLDDKRYVDEKGNPLPSGAPSPSEYKRMPVFLKLWMDQREISNLLVQLADGDLIVEIRQLRVNPRSGPGGGGGGMRSFSGPVGGGDDDVRRGPVVQRGLKQDDEKTQNPYDLLVELHGFIYIFNAPDPKLFVHEAVAAASVDGIPADGNPADGAGAESAPPADTAEGEAEPQPAAEKAAAGEAAAVEDKPDADKAVDEQPAESEAGDEKAAAGDPANEKPVEPAADKANKPPVGEAEPPAG